MVLAGLFKSKNRNALVSSQLAWDGFSCLSLQEARILKPDFCSRGPLQRRLCAGKDFCYMHLLFFIVFPLDVIVDRWPPAPPVSGAPLLSSFPWFCSFWFLTVPSWKNRHDGPLKRYFPVNTPDYSSVLFCFLHSSGVLSLRLVPGPRRP